jgi:excisionase family DNA binding protein
MNNIDRLHSLVSASEFLGGVSKYTIRQWIGRGRLRRVKLGRRVLIRESELKRLIEEGEGEGSSSAQKFREI